MITDGSYSRGLDMVHGCSSVPLMIHDDSVHTMQLFLISAQQSWFIGFIVPLGEHNQILLCTRRIRKRLPWLSQDLEASDLPCLEA